MATQPNSISPSPAARASAMIDPSTLMKLKNLEVRARVVVEGFLSGLHRSPYHGFSVEFSEYREYSPGDDVRYLDWKLYARSDRYYIKRFEDETNLRCHLLVDLSQSMGFGSTGYEKIEYAKTAAATLAYFLSLQRDAVGLVTFADAIQEQLPARYRPGHTHRIMIALERALSGSSTDISGPLESIAQTVTKSGMVVLISDLLTPLDDLQRNLGYLASRGHEVMILRVLDRAERTFPFEEAAWFVDPESGKKLYVDPQVARRNYTERFETHAQSLSDICAAIGVDLYTLHTDEPLEFALFDLLNSRMRRGRSKNRARNAAFPAKGGGR